MKVFTLGIFIIVIYASIFNWTMIIDLILHPIMVDGKLTQPPLLSKLLILEAVKAFFIAWLFYKL